MPSFTRLLLGHRRDPRGEIEKMFGDPDSTPPGSSILIQGPQQRSRGQSGYSRTTRSIFSSGVTSVKAIRAPEGRLSLLSATYLADQVKRIAR